MRGLCLEERQHFHQVIATFRHYAQYSMSTNNRRRRDIYRLSIADQEILDNLGYKKKLDDVDKAILANAQFVAQIIENPEIFELDADDGEADNNGAADSGAGRPSEKKFGSQRHPHPHPHSRSHGQDHAHTRTGSQKYKPSENGMDKLRSTLKQLVRDWSSEGKEERGACYEPIKDALLQHYSHIPEAERGNLRVLVPGAGLGRLAWDVAHLGFSCQGNEFSHYMLLSSFFVLNRTNQIEKHTIYPYVHSFSNIPNSRAMLRPIKIPDVLTSDLPSTADFSLVAGDFEEVYGSSVGPTEPHAGQWDAILTCFFVDTAKNVINYLRIIHKILSPGGIWINLGPLLWHWENNDTNDPSIELTLEEVKELALEIGFELSNERTINATYTNNAQSMMGYTYHAAFWTATKKLEQT
ncbi:N2227 domain containing protein [Amanita muscaria]